MVVTHWRLALCLVCAVSSTVAIAGQAIGGSNNTNCRAWRAFTVQNVIVGSDASALWFGGECNAALNQINVTFLCYPGASIRIDKWRMVGGFVRVAGPPESPWSVRDVTVVVTSSTIVAVEGPAVGIELGYGWPNTTATLFSVTNVTLFATQSTLSSTSTSGPASSLGCTVVDPSGGGPEVSISLVAFIATLSTLTTTSTWSDACAVGIAFGNVTTVSVASFLFALVNASAHAHVSFSRSGRTACTIAGVAVGFAAWDVVIDLGSAYVSWSSASCSVRDPIEGATVGGVAVGHARSVTISNATQFVTSTNVSSNCCSNSIDGWAICATSVGGVVVAWAEGAVTIIDATQYVSSTNANTTSSSNNRNNTDAFAVSSVGGVAVGCASSAVTVTNATQSVSLTNASSSSSGISSAWPICATSVGGVVVAWTGGSVMITNHTQYVLLTNTNSSSTSNSLNWDAFAVSGIGGVSVGYADLGGTISNVTQYVSLTNANSSNSGSNTNVTHSGSSVGGVAVAFMKRVTILAVTQYVSQSNCRSSSSSNHESSYDTYAFDGSTVGGVAIGGANGAVTIIDATQLVSSTNANSSISSSKSKTCQYYTYGGSSIGGVAVGWVVNGGPVTITAVTQYVSGSDAHSSSSGIAYAQAGSTVGGVVVAWASGGAVTVSNVTQYTSWTNASSNSTAAAHATSTAPGLASTPAPTVIAFTSIVSMSHSIACAVGAPGVSACGSETATTSSLCVNASSTNVYMSPPGVTAPVIVVAVPSVASVILAPPLRRKTPSRTRSRRRGGSGTLSMSLPSSVSRSRSLRTTSSPTLTFSASVSPATTPLASCTSTTGNAVSATHTQTSTARITSTKQHTTSTSPTYRLEPASPLPPLATTTTAVQTSATSIAVTSAVASIANGASGANAGRISIVLMLATCGDKDYQEEQEPLDRTSHPLGFGVAAAGSSVQYDAGLVLGNTALSALVTLLHFLVTYARSVTKRTAAVETESPLLRATMWSRFPGLSSAVHLYFLPLIAQSATSCVVRGAIFGVIVGVWGLVLSTCVVITLVYHTTVKLARCMECNDRFDTDEDGEPWLLRPQYSWTALPSSHYTTEQLCTCFGAYFEDYQYHGRWWLCVEVVTALASGAIGGVAGSATCLSVQIAAVVPNALYLVLVVAVRPHQRWLDFGASVGVGSLLLTSSIAVCLGLTTVATGAALGASIAGFAPALATPYKLLQQYRTLQRQKKAQRMARRRAVVTESTPESALLTPEFEVPSLPQVADPVAPSIDTTAVDLIDGDFDEAEWAMSGNIGTVLAKLELRRRRVTQSETAVDAELDELLMLGP